MLFRSVSQSRYEKLITIFTDEGDVIIDPVAGSGSSLVAGLRLNRKVYGFEIKKEFAEKGNKWIDSEKQKISDLKKYGFAKTHLENTIQPTLWS